MDTAISPSLLVLISKLIKKDVKPIQIDRINRIYTIYVTIHGVLILFIL